MAIRELTCISCPLGCPLKVETDENGAVLQVTGNTCKRGEVYGKKEVTAPERTVTSTVAVVDLMTVAKKQVSSSSSIEPYVVAILLYLVLNGAAEQLCKLAERKMSYYR